MKLKLALKLIIGLLLITSAQGQVRFSSVNVMGVGSGSNGESFVLSTINGISKDKWFTGVGVGLDYYRYRSIPVFS